MDVQDKFLSNLFRKYLDHKSSINYRTKKIDKICSLLTLGSFQLEDAHIFFTGRTTYIAKVLTDVHAKCGHFISSSLSRKLYGLQHTRKLIKFAFIFVRDHLYFKIRPFSMCPGVADKLLSLSSDTNSSKPSQFYSKTPRVMKTFDTQPI